MDPLLVFSIEGEWNPSQPRNRESVKSFLTVLEDLGEIEWFHRDAATRAEVNHLLDRWSTTRGYGKYKLLYLSFHGDAANGLWIPGEDSSISLGRLATRLKDACRGRVIHFGSCEVLNVKPARLVDFRDRTGASLVCGYTKSVDWVESAALDMLLISYLAAAARPEQAVKKLRKNNPVLVEKLGFVTSRRMSSPSASSGCGALRGGREST